MQRVYFFSRHEPQPQMVADLGGTITYQFRGTIDKVRRDGDNIKLTDSIEGEANIPADSIVVAVAPTALQEAWLKAGVGVLLIPQNNREITPDGQVVFNYAGLLQVEKIIIKTRQWAGAAPTAERKEAERQTLSAKDF